MLQVKFICFHQATNNNSNIEYKRYSQMDNKSKEFNLKRIKLNSAAHTSDIFLWNINETFLEFHFYIGFFKIVLQILLIAISTYNDKHLLKSPKRLPRTPNRQRETSKLFSVYLAVEVVKKLVQQKGASDSGSNASHRVHTTIIIIISYNQDRIATHQSPGETGRRSCLKKPSDVDRRGGPIHSKVDVKLARREVEQAWHMRRG